MKYSDCILDATTTLLLGAYRKHPTQALFLYGKEGVGLGTLAATLAGDLVTHPTNIVAITPDEKGTIGIDQVRSLYRTTKSKQDSKHVVVIDNIEAMGHEAQNAFLKLLEEPNESTYFILTSHAPGQILATITSRSETLEVRPISATMSQSLLRSYHVNDAQHISQMLFLASGLPAELHRLAHDKKYLEEQSQYVRVARQLVGAPRYEKLVAISSYTDRRSAQRLVATTGHLVEFMLTRTNDAKLVSAARTIELSADRLDHNGHVRTQLLNLAFHV